MASYAKLERIAEDAVAGLTAQLPSEVRAALEDLPVHLQADPDEEIAAEFGDDLLGLFTGEAIHERGESLDPLPPQIHLYLRNIWEESEHDPADYREEVRITFLHELGHYLGWDEEDMEQHGLG
jgi:predicted Zn-dependent protease with MMP-like domain